MTDVPGKKLRPGDVLMRKGTKEFCTVENVIAYDGKVTYVFKNEVGTFAAVAGALSWLMEHGADPGSFLVFQRGAAPEVKREEPAKLRDYASALKFDIQLKGA